MQYQSRSPLIVHRTPKNFSSEMNKAKPEIDGHDSMKEVFAELKKSFEHLYKGERENGEPLCTAEAMLDGSLLVIEEEY